MRMSGDGDRHQASLAHWPVRQAPWLLLHGLTSLLEAQGGACPPSCEPAGATGQRDRQHDDQQAGGLVVLLRGWASEATCWCGVSPRAVAASGRRAAGGATQSRRACRCNKQASGWGANLGSEPWLLGTRLVVSNGSCVWVRAAVAPASPSPALRLVFMCALAAATPGFFSLPTAFLTQTRSPSLTLDSR